MAQEGGKGKGEGFTRTPRQISGQIRGDAEAAAGSFRSFGINARERSRARAKRVEQARARDSGWRGARRTHRSFLNRRFEQLKQIWGV